MWYVLFIALTNLALGGGLALVLKRRCDARRRARAKKESEASSNRYFSSNRPTVEEFQERELASTGVPEFDPASNIPVAWQRTGREGVVKNPVLQGILVVTAECESALDWLLEIERFLGDTDKRVSKTKEAEARSGLQELLQSVIQRCQEVTEVCEYHDYRFEGLTSTALQLEQLTTSVCMDLEFGLKRLAIKNARAKPAETLDRLQAVRYQAAALIHQLRDGVQQCWLTVGSEGHLLDSLEGRAKVDPGTQLENTLGLVRAFADWKHEDPEALRLVSFAQFDLDATAQLNCDRGLAEVDRVLKQIGKLLSEGVRQNRGFSRVFRTGGQSFLAFLGDAGGKFATTLADTLRAEIAAGTFPDGGPALEVTCCTGVVPLEKEMSLVEAVERLNQAVRRAKANGPNLGAAVVKGKLTVTEGAAAASKAEPVLA